MQLNGYTIGERGGVLHANKLGHFIGSDRYEITTKKNENADRLVDALMSKWMGMAWFIILIVLFELTLKFEAYLCMMGIPILPFIYFMAVTSYEEIKGSKLIVKIGDFTITGKYRKDLNLEGIKLSAATYDLGRFYPKGLCPLIVKIDDGIKLSGCMTDAGKSYEIKAYRNEFRAKHPYYDEYRKPITFALCMTMIIVSKVVPLALMVFYYSSWLFFNMIEIGGHVRMTIDGELHIFPFGRFMREIYY